MTRLRALAFTMPCLLAATAGAEEIHDCLIEPAMVVEIGAATEGVIEEINAERGAKIEKGQIIARLQSNVEEESLRIAERRAESEYGVALAEARVDLAQKQYERAASLVERRAGTVADRDIAEAELKAAQVELLQAKEDKVMSAMERDRAKAVLERRLIRAPIDGVMLRRLIGPGEFAHSQAQVAQIASVDPLYVDVFLPTSTYNEISIGQRAIVRPKEPIGGTYEATIEAIDQVFDAASDTFGVRLELPNPGGKLPGGVDCTLELPTG